MDPRAPSADASRPRPASGRFPTARRDPRALRALAAAAAVGGLSLVEQRRLGPVQRAAYRLSVSAVSGLIAADVAPDDISWEHPAQEGLFTGALTLGTMDLTEWLDARVLDGLERRGVRAPRAWLAGAGMLGVAAIYALPRLLEHTTGGPGAAQQWRSPQDVFADPEPYDLPAPARDLISTLLQPPRSGAGIPAGAGIPGAPALRGQLETARAMDLGFPSCDVQLEVAAPERLAVPHEQTWPVSGHFQREGIGLEATLQISEGRLGLLTFAPQDGEARVEKALEILAAPAFTMPSPEDLTLQVDSDTLQIDSGGS